MTNEPDPRDYLAMLALGLDAAGQPHVWETPKRSVVSGALTWSCKFCKTPYSHARRDEGCPEMPPGVARPGG